MDWNEPLLSQVGKLADRYWEWVNLPVNRRIRLFKSNFLEYLTITPWYLVPIVWIPISIYFVCLGIVTNNHKHIRTYNNNCILLDNLIVIRINISFSTDITAFWYLLLLFYE